MPIDSSKVRLVDIAQKAGVSRAAVGHVLNQSGVNNVRVSPETREKILRIAQEMNYRPNRAAQQLRGKPTHMLGVIVNTVNTSVFSARLSAIEVEAQARGYRMVIGQVHQNLRDVEGYLNDFADRGIDGVLCLFDVMEETRAGLQSIFKGRRGIVVHAAPILKEHSTVRVDTENAISQLVTHLVERGRKRIGLVLGSYADQLMALRARAWKAAMKAHNLPALPELVWHQKEGVRTPQKEEMDKVIEQIVLEHKADAIISSNDVWAARVIQSLRRKGLSVPKDVAVTGYDNIDIAEICDPSLTTIDQCHADYAVAALDLMEESLKKTTRKRPSEQRLIQPRLIVREST